LILSPLLSALQKASRSVEEPLGLVRLVIGTFALVGTFIAVIVGVTTEPRMLELVGTLWAVYGLVVGFTSGVLEPVIDGLFSALSSVGLLRVGGGYSAIETMVARGHLTAAAEAYAERARDPRERVEATLRRAELLAESLDSAETAAVELDGLRTHPLSRREDFRVGVALVALYEHHMADPGRAMAELRRLIDRHPSARDARRLRAALTELKSERFAAVPQS
jgi:hypothetical protein